MQKLLQIEELEFKNKKINGVFGEVIKILPGGMFRVKLNDGQLLVAHVSFKIKMDRTPILKGNIVFMQRADNKSKNAIILKKYTA